MSPSPTVPVVSSLDAIYTPDILTQQAPRWRSLYDTFASVYHGAAPHFVARSPGRVNIIGEHIDYSLYPVLPMAISADALIAVRCEPAQSSQSSSSSSSSSSSIRVRLANVDAARGVGMRAVQVDGPDAVRRHLTAWALV